MTKFIAILLGMGFMANAAIATSEQIVEIDANGDGMMTVDEIQAVYPEMTAEAFAEADLNSDGVLDDAEMVAGQERGLIPASSGG